MVRSRGARSVVFRPGCRLLAVALAAHVTFGSANGARADGPPPPGETTETSDAGATRRLVALALGEVGLASLIAGTLFAFRASSSWSAAHDECPSSAHCPNHALAVSDHDRASTFATASTISLVVAVAGLGSGGVLFFTAPSASPRTTFTVAPEVGAGGGGLVVGGSF